MREALIGVVVLALVWALFQPLERRWPAQPKLRRTWPELRTDLTYALWAPLLNRGIRRLGIGGAALAVAWALDVELRGDDGLTAILARGPLNDLPLAAQGALGLLIIDFGAYWLHRLFHRGRLWPFHAIHHAPTELDALAAVRVHPINEVLTRVPQFTLLLLLGLDLRVLAGLVPLLTLHALLLHANVSWGLGPFGAVLSSPRFHRWHHSCEAEGLDKNFGGFFVVWDRLFGTYWMPHDRDTIATGIHGAQPPRGYWRQLWWPFRGTSAQDPAKSAR